MSISWKVIALSLIALLCTDARAFDRPEDHDIFADDGYIHPGWLCEACRDPLDHPGDFAAFAYNAYFGSDQWAFDSELGIPFRIYTLAGQWVAVWFENFLFDSISLLPNTLDVRIRLETGEVITITLVQGGPDLPVGDDAAVTEPAPCDCDGEESDEEEDEFEDDGPLDEGFEWEDPDPEGYVEIVDPDENGDFPDWDEEI
jgi:hypothetical protein